MQIRCVWEHNGSDTLLYSDNYIGAFARGATKDIALEKMAGEVKSYLMWAEGKAEDGFTAQIVQEKESTLQICDADTDVIFSEERKPLCLEEYLRLKALALKSAADFYEMYMSVPDKNKTCLPVRKTFYGTVPRTAYEMYEHTKNVNFYYFGEIGIDAPNDGSIHECRKKGFELLERAENYLDNDVLCGSYDEYWSLRKVLRRFIWHDRIHAKAMYRMAVKAFGTGAVINTFRFNLIKLRSSEADSEYPLDSITQACCPSDAIA